MDLNRKDEGGTCAFCGRQGNMSREHVFPAWMSQRLPDPLIANIRTAKGEIAITGEQTVKDVCRECNNGPLSELDEYMRELYERYFHRIVQPGDLVIFDYDFDRLLRSLLKVAYNMARARGWEFKLSRGAVRFILTGAPFNIQPEVLLQLIIPTRERPGEHERIDPIENRVALLVPAFLPGIEAAALVSFRSYHFYVLLPHGGRGHTFADRVFEKVRKVIPGAVRLSDKKIVKVYSSFVDFFSAASQSPGFVRNVRLKAATRSGRGKKRDGTEAASNAW